MTKVRIGVVGIGAIGTAHAVTLYNGEIEGARLTALCDTDETRIAELKEEFPSIPAFASSTELIESGLVDAIIISTPHYFHPIIAKQALEKGIHTLSEKPIGVYTKGLDELFEIQKRTNTIFAVMFNQRVNKLFKEAKRIVDSKEIGEIKRSVWIVTNWYRTQAYYDSGSWRATWSGEGGGVLMNQAPHNLDLWQWICGMPKSIYAVCNESKYHQIEVEDEATIYAEYENGASGVFISSTGDFPGTNRLEITGTMGRIILEGAELRLQKFSNDERELCNGACDKIEITESIIRDEEYNGHKEIIQNLVNSILKSEPLISPAYEGMNELMICNGAYMSSWTGEKVSLPLDEDKYLEMLKNKAKGRLPKGKENKNNLLKTTYLKKWNTNW